MAEGGKTGFDEFYDYALHRQIVDAIEKDLTALDSQFTRFSKTLKSFGNNFKKSLDETANAMKANTESMKGLDKTQIAAVDSITQLTKQNEQYAKIGKQYASTVKSIDQTVKVFSGSVDGQKDKIKALTAEFNSLDPKVKANQQRLQKLSQELIKARSTVQEMTKATRDSNNVLNRAEGSYNALTAAIAKDVAAIKQIPGAVDKSSAAYRKNEKQIQSLQARIRTNTEALKSFDAQIGRNFRNVGNYSSALGGLGRTAQSFAGALGFVGGTFLLAQGLRESIRNNIELSDALANVRKTTDLTDVGVRKLADSLNKLNTRTSLEGLLQITTAAGRLDVAQEDLLAFTEAVDRVVVALGDELKGTDEEIATTVARIAGVFGEEEQFGIAKAITRIGSGINQLGKDTKASGDFIVDFTQRLGGVAPQAGIAASEILGLGATFQELGQSPEIAASSVNRFLIQVGRDVPKFAAIAGKSVEEFSALLKEDAVEAFLQVIQTANATEGGLAALADSLGELGVDQVRAISALGALANNTDRARRNIDISNKAVEEAISLDEEFAIKNENLAASADKLSKAFFELTTDGTAFSTFLKGSIDTLTAFVKGISAASEGTTTLEDDLFALVSGPLSLILAGFNQMERDAEDLKKANEPFGPDNPFANEYLDGLADSLEKTKEVTKATKDFSEELEKLKGKDLTDIFNISLSEFDTIEAQQAAQKLADDFRSAVEDVLSGSGQEKIDSIVEQLILGEDPKEIIDEQKAALDESEAIAEEYRRRELDKTERQEMIKRELIRGTFDVINSFSDTLFTNQQIRLDNELTALERQRDKEIDLAGDNAAAKESIERNFETQRKKIQQEQAEAQRKATLFNLGLRIPEAIVTGLLQGGPPLAAIYGAVATAQLIAAQAVDIPVFGEGTDNAPGGTVLVNERKKRELITTPEGKSFYFDKKGPVLTDMIPKGSKIDPRDISELTNVSEIIKDYSPITGQHAQMLENFRLNDLLQSINITNNNQIDYDRLARMIAEQIPAGQNFFIEEGKIKKAIIKGNSKKVVGTVDVLKGHSILKDVDAIKKKLGL